MNRMNLPENKVTELIQGADRSKWMVHSNHNIKCFTKGEIEIITNNYRTMVGRGGFGEVFEGVLEDGSMVAVKKFIQNVKANFAKELIVHREINHKNVVRLIGYCVEESALMMVTEYIPNGNLSDLLHCDNRNIPLDIRLRIATECAEALAYMHSYMYTQVIHGDIKPANILLDGSFSAKISDFGISRLVNTGEYIYTENVMGSIGYMDPLFARDGRLTVKSDVYSFGVLLVELVTRKRATTVGGDVNIVYLFTTALARGVGGVRDMFDPEIAKQNNMKFLEGIAKLAGDCLGMERDRRPEMIDVAERLRMLSKASHRGEQRIGIFSWVRKNIRAPPAGVTKNVRAPPAGVTTSTKTLTSDTFLQFSLAEIMAATNDFDISLHVGGSRFGDVYRGNILNGTTSVIVKRLFYMGARGASRFRTEVEIRSKLRHHNVVPLIGFCDEKNEFTVVYDYMARGSLHEQLYNTHKHPLTWKQRLEICIGAARGLHYLHSHGGGEHALIHRTGKLTDILLDEEGVVKISHNVDSDPVTSATCPWMLDICDPEYIVTAKLTEKSDVYYFGAVLFHVLCVRRVLDRSLPAEQMNLFSWAVRCKEERSLDQIVDPYLKGKINPQCLNKFVETAVKCVVDQGIDRPSMGDVVSDLEYTLQLQENAEAGEDLAAS